MRIETSRLILRDWKSDDWNSFSYWQKPGNKWQELDGPYYVKSGADLDGLWESFQRRLDWIEKNPA